MRNRYLLDTCTFIWTLTAPELLPDNVRRLLQNDAIFYVSAITIWEMRFLKNKNKISLPSFDLLKDLRQQLGFEFLALEEAVLTANIELPDIHQDPFDRMLVRQALFHNLTLLTPDKKIINYPVLTLWK